MCIESPGRKFLAATAREGVWDSRQNAAAAARDCLFYHGGPLRLTSSVVASRSFGSARDLPRGDSINGHSEVVLNVLNEAAIPEVSICVAPESADAPRAFTDDMCPVLDEDAVFVESATT